MKTGASDFIPKSSISSQRLHEAIETGYESYRRQQTQARRQQRLKESAFKDDVTGLGNLNYLRMRLRRVLKDPDVENVAVLLIGIENMDMIHASLGKGVGDKLRRRIGQLMQSATREGDTVGRYRGDIFCAIFPGLTRETASQKADRILDDLRGEGNSEIEGPLKSLDYRASLVERVRRKEDAKEVFARVLEQLDTLRCGNEGGISIGF
jgi:diguanylate cyclase (GGDEF)-like protein